MATLRELKGRIGSVASSEKITGAMKMISSAKMHRAEAELRRQLPFRRQIETIMGNLLTADAEFSSPLTETREVHRIGIVVFGSDDGLCGGFNINIFKELLALINDRRDRFGAKTAFTVIPVGKKMAKACAKIKDDTIGIDIPADITSKSEGDAVKNFCTHLQQQFTSGALDRIELLYMNFQSVSRQRVKAEEYLPLEAATILGEGVHPSARPCIFEPDAPTIFRSVIPLFLLSMLFEVFTENRASEQAARIMAMQSANDNAKKLLEQLQLEYNKLRQQSITSELLDIIGGQINN